jgi:hypothetical protein
MCIVSENKEDCEASNMAKLKYDTPIVWKDYKQSAADVKCQL